LLRVLRATHDPRRVLIVLLGDPGRLEPLARAIPDTEDFRVVEYPKAT